MKTHLAHRPLAWIPLGIGCLLATPLVLPLQAAPEESASAQLPQPVVNTHDLMHLFNEPLYKRLKQEMQSEPSSDKQWRTIADRGMQAAEIANLIAIRQTTHDPQHWKRYAAGVQQAGKSLAESAKTQDFVATKEAYRTLIQQCNECHNRLAASPHAPTLEP